MTLSQIMIRGKVIKSTRDVIVVKGSDKYLIEFVANTGAIAFDETLKGHKVKVTVDVEGES